jgi:hypothetical protein
MAMAAAQIERDEPSGQRANAAPTENAVAPAAWLQGGKRW